MPLYLAEQMMMMMILMWNSAHRLLEIRKLSSAVTPKYIEVEGNAVDLGSFFFSKDTSPLL
jgi:hypothetical protein